MNRTKSLFISSKMTQRPSLIWETYYKHLSKEGGSIRELTLSRIPQEHLFRQMEDCLPLSSNPDSQQTQTRNIRLRICCCNRLLQKHTFFSMEAGVHLIDRNIHFRSISALDRWSCRSVQAHSNSIGLLACSSLLRSTHQIGIGGSSRLIMKQIDDLKKLLRRTHRPYVLDRR